MVNSKQTLELNSHPITSLLDIIRDGQIYFNCNHNKEGLTAVVIYRTLFIGLRVNEGQIFDRRGISHLMEVKIPILLDHSVLSWFFLHVILFIGLGAIKG